MFLRVLCIAAIGFFLLSCDSGEEREQGIESSQFSACNDMLSFCGQGSGQYCLFGFKWGGAHQFTPVGFDAEGPREAASNVTFSFQNGSDLLNTHRQLDVVTRPFDDVQACARTQIRRALTDWAAAGGIDFTELPEDSDSDIRFFAADIIQSGIGYPNFEEGRCEAFSGNVIIRPNSRFNNCELFYKFMLHEIGHALGLGHVDTENIMNPEGQIEALDGLQAGDVEGIRALYGEN